MTLFQFYLGLCCSLGITQFAEGWSYRRRYVQISQLSKGLSLLESAWLVVTLVAMANSSLPELALLAAWLYIGLFVTAIIYVWILVARTEEQEHGNIQIPNLYFRIYAAIAASYVLLNALTLWQTY